eukprot:Transcript_942.p1 GENE.Transcript_942~~Transcript_942.p1  ORF type:complete len:285 (-),score=111.19 Transcript_942:1117-1971(-)
MAAAAPSSEPKPDDPAAEQEDLDKAMQDDWDRMQEGLRERRAASGRATSQEDEDDDELDEDDPLFAHRRRRLEEPESPFSARSCCLILLAVLIFAALVGGAAYAHWRFPRPLNAAVAQVRPQKFKIDVTDFFAPHVSAAVQLVLSVRNSNLLRALLLDGLTLSVYEAETGLKLGSATQGALMIGAMTNTQVTLAVTRLGTALPPPQQQRLASSFLSHKALLLTFVVTATSRLPIKGSKATQTSSNTTRRVDLSGLYKDPFFQRAPTAVPPTGAADDDKVHDVPI